MPGPAGRGSGETVGPRGVTLDVMRPAALAATLSGRAEERARLLDVVRAGLDGSPRAVLVHGEAGIGKTTLVRSVCEQVAGEGAQVLWGQSLRFGAVEAMYHPLVLALEGWLAEADDAERASVIEAVPAAALILPSLGASPPDGPSMLMMVVDALLSRVVARGPTVLVVDDVQWADPATWDALSYLVAGFGRQRLALVTTHRDEAAVSDSFQHWLGNVRRLPGTEELVLTRLDQDATGDQIAVLLGRPPSPRLVEQVYDRSRGNPYFSELLVRRGDLDSSELPDDLPDELSQALLDAWRGLSAPAREITRILAIAGRPTDLRTLAAIAAELGISRGRVGPRGRRRRGRRARRRRRLVPAPAAGRRAGRVLPARRGGAGARGLGRSPGVGLHRRCRRAAPARRPRVAPRAGRRRLGGVRRPPPGRRPRREARRASRGRRPAGPGGRPVGGGCRRHRHRRPRAAARAGRRCLRLGRADARRLPTAPRGTRPRLPRTRPALGEQTDGCAWRASRSTSARPRTLPRRASSEPWSSPGSSPTAASTPRPWPAMPTPCSGQGGMTRHAGWSRTPWRPPTARAPPPPSAGPMASVPRSVLETDLAAGRPGRDGLLGAGLGLGRARGHRRRIRRQADDLVCQRVTCAASTSMRATYYEWLVPQGRRRCSRASSWPRSCSPWETSWRPRASCAPVWRPPATPRRGADPAPRGGAGRRAGAQRRGARSPGPRPRDHAPPRGAARVRGWLADGRDAAGPGRPSRGVRARRARAALQRRGPAGARRADGARGPGRGRPGPASIGRPRPGRRTAPSGGPDQAGEDAGDPARHRLPALRPRRHRPARPGRPLRRRVRASRRGRGPGAASGGRRWRRAPRPVSAGSSSSSSWRLAAALVESGASGTEAAELLRGVHDYAVRGRAPPR